MQKGPWGPDKSTRTTLTRLGKLDLDHDAPWTAGGPVRPACAMIAGAWCLTRKVGLSTARSALVQFETDGNVLPAVRWALHATKTDTESEVCPARMDAERLGPSAAVPLPSWGLAAFAPPSRAPSPRVG